MFSNILDAIRKYWKPIVSFIFVIISMLVVNYYFNKDNMDDMKAMELNKEQYGDVNPIPMGSARKAIAEKETIYVDMPTTHDTIYVETKAEAPSLTYESLSYEDRVKLLSSVTLYEFIKYILTDKMFYMSLGIFFVILYVVAYFYGSIIYKVAYKQFKKEQENK